MSDDKLPLPTYDDAPIISNVAGFYTTENTNPQRSDRVLDSDEIKAARIAALIAVKDNARGTFSGSELDLAERGKNLGLDADSAFKAYYAAAKADKNPHAYAQELQNKPIVDDKVAQTVAEQLRNIKIEDLVAIQPEKAFKPTVNIKPPKPEAGKTEPSK